MEDPMKLNLGCGRNILQGYLNVDMYGGEIICDACALPFRDGVFDEIFTSHMLEHILDFGKVIWEMHRTLKSGGILHIVAPYGLGRLYNPFHYHPINLTTFDSICKDGNSLETKRLFRILRRKISDYRIPFKWHLHKYLPFLRYSYESRDHRIKTNLPLGPRNELTFWLEKI